MINFNFQICLLSWNRKWYMIEYNRIWYFKFWVKSVDIYVIIKLINLNGTSTCSLYSIGKQMPTLKQCSYLVMNPLKSIMIKFFREWHKYFNTHLLENTSTVLRCCCTSLWEVGICTKTLYNHLYWCQHLYLLSNIRSDACNFSSKIV